MEKSTRYMAKVTRYDWHSVTTCQNLLPKSNGELLVVNRIRDHRHIVPFDDVGQVDILSRDTTILQQCRHVSAGKLLALTYDLVLGARADLFKVLSGLQDLDELLALILDIPFQRVDNIPRSDCVFRGLDMVGLDLANDVD